jgi:hypothetical protein
MSRGQRRAVIDGLKTAATAAMILALGVGLLALGL